LASLMDNISKDDAADSDPLQNIKQFVETTSKSDEKSTESVGDEKKVTIANAHKDGEQTASKAQSQWKRYCAAITRDASIDSQAVARSLMRLDAKLKLVKASETEHEQNAAYFRAQSDLLDKQLLHLSGLSEAEKERNADSLNGLRRTADKLVVLINKMGSDALQEEQHSASTGTLLLENVKKHQALLEDGHAVFQHQHQAVETSIQTVKDLLITDTKSTERRLSQFKAEAQLLTSLRLSKQESQKSAASFHESSKKLCLGA